MYEYTATVVRVVDGDSVYLDIDLGFGIWLRNENVRLYGINAPETRTRDKEEKERGLMAKSFLSNKINIRTHWNNYTPTVTLISEAWKRGKYGRILGTLYFDGS